MARVAVGGIVDPGLLPEGQCRHERIPGDGKQGAEQADAVARRVHRKANRRHGGEPVDAASSGESLKHGLGLILLLVCQQQMKDACLPAPADKQREPRGPRHLLNSRDRAGAFPTERSVEMRGRRTSAAPGRPQPPIQGANGGRR